MQTRIQSLVIGLLVIGGMSVGGCHSPQVEEPQPQINQYSLEQTECVIAQAKEHLETIQTLPIRDLFPDDFQDAQNALVHSEECLDGNAFDAAYQAAQESQQASQRILRKFYQQIIVQSAARTKADIQEIAKDDPDNPLQDFIPELNDILDYADGLEDEQQLVDLEKVKHDFDAVRQVEHNAKENVKRTLEMDVSFAPGKYGLSEQGEQILQEYSHKILVSKSMFDALYPDDPVVITIKVIGYADPVRFREGTTLLQRLAEGVEDEVPHTEPARRKFFNQRLSEFRARVIAEYTAALLVQQGAGQSRFQVKQEIFGLGETLPPGVEPPYPVQDPRRRFCKIYSYITTP